MINPVRISCTINTTNPDAELGLAIWIDKDCVFDQNHITQKIFFEHDLSDAEASHCLKFIMQGKTFQHTKLSQAGEIIEDARLTIQDLKFEQIDLGQLFIDKSTYTHDFNGTAAPGCHKFYGEMGCNGVVELKFTTPIYLWLLENM